MTAAAIALWTGHAPRLDVLAVPAEGLVLSRGLLGDDRMSEPHARLMPVDGRLEVADLGSKNGTFVAGNRMRDEPLRPHLPVLVRTGRTVLVLVADAAPYAGVRIERRGELVVGASLGPVCRAVDDAALAEDNLAIVGAPHVGRALARLYAAQRSGACATYDGSTSLERAIASASGPPRTLVLDGVPRDEDRATLALWLETDVRVVTVVDTALPLASWPAVLALRTVAVPHPRLDEWPTILHDLAGDVALHAGAVEAMLLDLWRTGEASALARIRDDVATARAENRGELRDDDLTSAPVQKYAIGPWTPRG